MTAALHAAFFVSGAAALALEMLWMRSAALALGGTAATGAAVLGCYFAGLAGGAALARHGHAWPVRRYGWLELGAAAGGVWSWGVFAILAQPAVQRAVATAGDGGRLGIVALAVLPASLCLGATLPALGQALAHRTAGTRGSVLAALNTLGAAAGAAAAGFSLPALVGVRTTYAIAIGASALAGSVALRFADRFPAAAAVGAGPSAAVEPRRMWAVAAGSGALALGLEVLWIRVFAQILHNSVYSFTAVAIVFLIAIALGDAIASASLRRVAPHRLAAGMLIAAGLSTVGGYWLFVRLTDGLTYVGMTDGLGEYLLRILGIGAVTAGPAALASAAVLPALWASYPDGGSAARPLGTLSAANSLGAALGAVAAGFVVMPGIGVRGGLLLAAIGYIVLADVVQPAHQRWRLLGYGSLLLLAVADPMRLPLAHPRDAAEVVRSTSETAAGIVSVVDTGTDTQLRLDNYYTLGGSAAVANERRQGLLPLLLHPAPRRVAFIGLATGISVSAAPALGVVDTTVFELVPEVAAAARAHFAHWNDGLLDRPDVHLVLDDGRRGLATAVDRWDVIVSDLFIPWHAGTGSLYAREMYDIVAGRLAPGGLFCQWLPLYQMTREEFDVVAHTFLTVFPHATLWRDDFYADRPIVALIGGIDVGPVDLDALTERLRTHATQIRDPMLATPQALAMLYAGDLAASTDLFANAALNLDDRPVIEFLAPRLTRMSASGDKDWFTGASLAEFYETLAARTESTAALLPASAATDAGRRAGLALFRYTLAQARHDDDAARREQAAVRSLVPEVVARADDAADPNDTLRDAPGDTLDGLRSEQSALRHELADMERRLTELKGGRQ